MHHIVFGARLCGAKRRLSARLFGPDRFPNSQRNSSVLGVLGAIIEHHTQLDIAFDTSINFNIPITSPPNADRSEVFFGSPIDLVPAPGGRFCGPGMGFGGGPWDAPESNTYIYIYVLSCLYKADVKLPCSWLALSPHSSAYVCPQGP